jgi:hypothetical protein
MKKLIKIIKPKFYKFGMSLSPGEYLAYTDGHNWFVKKGLVSLALGKNDFEFVN